MNLKLVKTLTLVMAAGLAVGCASSGDLEAVRNEARQAQATANDAKSTAETALASANEARSLAQEANSRSKATEEKINRMFKRSMFK